MSIHPLSRRCECGNQMFVVVDHDEQQVRGEGCLLCYRGKLRHQVHMPIGRTILIGQGRSSPEYIVTVVCAKCLKNRLVKTFVEQKP